MGYEDRDYYREPDWRGDQSDSGGGIPGFRFGRQSIITSIIVVNVAIFILDTFTGPINDIGDRWLSHVLALKSDKPWEVWTFLTSGFAHASMSSKAGIFHVAFNMATLFFIGRPVEQSLGRAEFLRFYLFAILAGSLGWFLSEWLQGSGGFVVGASGAVSAVVIYFIFMAPHAQLLLMGFIPMPAWGVGVLFLVMNLYHAVSQDHVAWEAHLAGGAFGMLYFYYKWNFSAISMPSFGQSSKLRVHRPEGEIDEKLQAEADRILEKINESGQESLTRRERKTLERYSAAVRKRRG
ncbi:MAG: rhomboid family intramembrane serine protease [Planctomycetota bacterium]